MLNGARAIRDHSAVLFATTEGYKRGACGVFCPSVQFCAPFDNQDRVLWTASLHFTSLDMTSRYQTGCKQIEIEYRSQDDVRIPNFRSGDFVANATSFNPLPCIVSSIPLQDLLEAPNIPSTELFSAWYPHPPRHFQPPTATIDPAGGNLSCPANPKSAHNEHQSPSSPIHYPTSSLHFQVREAYTTFYYMINIH